MFSKIHQFISLKNQLRACRATLAALRKRHDRLQEYLQILHADNVVCDHVWCLTSVDLSIYDIQPEDTGGLMATTAGGKVVFSLTHVVPIDFNGNSNGFRVFAFVCTKCQRQLPASAFDVASVADQPWKECDKADDGLYRVCQQASKVLPAPREPVMAALDKVLEDVLTEGTI